MGHIGFIGLGMMGRPMASRLHAAGHDLIVFDASAAAVRAFGAAHAGVAAADDMAAFAACRAVVLMLPDSDAVEAVVLGRDGAPGLIGVLPRGAVVIDMGSSQPLRSRALAERLRRAGKEFLDAPVSGGVKRAVDGSLAIMVGGDAAVLAAQQDLLAHMGRTITHVGAVGAGHAMKALNNYVSAAGLLATVEALHVGRRFGLDPALMTDVLNSSTGKNNTTENKVKPFMLTGAFDSGFALALMCKDLGIAMSLGRAIQCPMPLGDEVLALWSEAAAELGKAADHTEMYRWTASRSG
jgi:3-hydroxyisobutyrate dehydrogenase